MQSVPFLAKDYNTRKVQVMGASCQTTGSRKAPQREAAIKVVQTIGLRQIRDVDLSIFDGIDQEQEIFLLRRAELTKFEK